MLSEPIVDCRYKLVLLSDPRNDFQEGEEAGRTSLLHPPRAENPRYAHIE